MKGHFETCQSRVRGQSNVQIHKESGTQVKASGRSLLSTAATSSAAEDRWVLLCL